MRGAEEARAVNDVGVAGEDRRDEVRILGGIVLEIGVLDERDVALEVRDGGADRRALALVLRLEDRLQPIVVVVRGLGDELANHVRRAVARAVVDDDDLLADRHRTHVLQDAPQRPALVEHRHDDREEKIRLLHGANLLAASAAMINAATKCGDANRLQNPR